MTRPWPRRTSRPADDGGTGPVPGYRIVDEIGRGASGRVHRAVQLRLGREVALKVLDVAPDREARDRFDREVEVTVRLGSHPHIAQVLDAGRTADGRPYLAMELYERGSCQDALARHGPFPEAEAVTIGAAVADALAAAHAAGILHRDVKPENVLLSAYGPALTDFGVARPVDTHRTGTVDHFTPWHAAPEVLRGRPPAEASDVYSLASTLVTLLEGRPPFAGPAGESLLTFEQRVLGTDPPRLPDGISPDLRALLVEALDRDPALRPASAAALRDRLRALEPARSPSATVPPPAAAASSAQAGGPGGHGEPSGTGDGHGETVERRVAGREGAAGGSPGDPGGRRWRVVAGVVLAVAVAAGVAWWLGARSEGEDEPDRGATASTTTLATVDTAPEEVPGRPEGVRVRDDGTSATVTWRDTSGGRGLPVVHVVPEQGALTSNEVAVGATTFTATGLDPALGYCFVVTELLRPPEGAPVSLQAEPVCIRGAAMAPTTTTSPPAATPTTAQRDAPGD